MEITVELLRKIRKIIKDDYDEQVEICNELTDIHKIIDSSRRLSFMEGKLMLLALLEYILEDDYETIEALEYYLKEDF